MNDLNAGAAEHLDGDLSIAVDAVAPSNTDTLADAGPVDTSAFAALGLAPELLAAIADLGFTEPTPVQQAAIPKALPTAQSGGAEGSNYNDLMVSSQTGSGKTAAFLLPVLHTLLAQKADADAKAKAEYEAACAAAAAKGEALPKRQRRKDPTNPRNFKAATPGALVLCPTRELAQQVANDAIDLVRHCRGLRIANVVGGMPYAMQIAKLQNANLVVATPGRLLDLQRSVQIKLEQVQFLVVDEADRMLDLGFADDLAEIHQLTRERQQTMMFSATFAPRIQQLAARVMRQPQRLEMATPQERHANIRQSLYWADNGFHKRQLLDHWLRDASIDQAIVFASTQIECDGLANDLQQAGFSAVALHGALSQGLRNRRLQALRRGQVQILVATDVAARGIDVPTITHVFNYGLPMKAEDFTHRVGRTGRAGRDGQAITFAEHREWRKIEDIQHFIQQRLPVKAIPGLEPSAPPKRPSKPSGKPGGRFGGKPGGRPMGRSGAPAGRPAWGDDGAGREGRGARPQGADSFVPRGADHRGSDRSGERAGGNEWRPARGPRQDGPSFGGERRPGASFGRPQEGRSDKPRGPRVHAPERDFGKRDRGASSGAPRKERSRY